MFHCKRFIVMFVGVALAGGALCSTARAAASYSTGFEDFTTGPMSSSAVGPTQGGWSGGAVGGFVNNDPGDEEIINSPASAIHSGSQAWHYARGYNSPGSGTPYTPNVDPVDTPGKAMTGSIWFKAAAPNDGSLLALETGNLAGDDRAEILAYIDNNSAGGMVVRSFTNGPSFDGVPIASGLSMTDWHNIAFTMTYTGSQNAISMSVDGASPVNFDGSLKGYRDSLSAPYSESSRLKFRARHPDGDPSFNGFFLDDISYSVGAVPEPASLSLAGLAGLGLLARRRRR